MCLFLCWIMPWTYLLIFKHCYSLQYNMPIRLCTMHTQRSHIYLIACSIGNTQKEMTSHNTCCNFARKNNNWSNSSRNNSNILISIEVLLVTFRTVMRSISVARWSFFLILFIFVVLDAVFLLLLYYSYAHTPIHYTLTRKYNRGSFNLEMSSTQVRHLIAIIWVGN